MISVIIPVYNRKEALRNTLLSLEKQICFAFDVIVVDDGSTEDIATVIEQVRDKVTYPLTYYRQENAGAPAARNYGFSLSTGKYILFLDADVIAEPELLQLLHTALAQAPEVSYAYSHFYFGKKKMFAKAFDAAALRETNYISTMSLIRRSDFPGFDESLTRFQDWDLWLTLLAEGKTGVFVDSFLFRAAPHEKGMSAWLPSFAYKKPWRYLPWWKKKVDAYEAAKQSIRDKHPFIKEN